MLKANLSDARSMVAMLAHFHRHLLHDMSRFEGLEDDARIFEDTQGKRCYTPSETQP